MHVQHEIEQLQCPSTLLTMTDFAYYIIFAYGAASIFFFADVKGRDTSHRADCLTFKALCACNLWHENASTTKRFCKHMIICTALLWTFSLRRNARLAQTLFQRPLQQEILPNVTRGLHPQFKDASARKHALPLGKGNNLVS